MLESNPDTTMDDIDTSVWFQVFDDNVCEICVDIEIEPNIEKHRNVNLRYKCIYDLLLNKLEEEYATVYYPVNTWPYRRSKSYDYNRGMYKTKEWQEAANEIIKEILKELDGD